jgi:hypothetical protein
VGKKEKPLQKKGMKKGEKRKQLNEEGEKSKESKSRRV